MKKISPKAVLVLTAFLLLILVLCSFSLGRYPVSVQELLNIITARMLGREENARMAAVVFNIRLPRILLAVLVGGSLSAAGAAYQGVFQNPMASPDVLGASQGAAFGAAFAILQGGGSGMVTLSAFLFSLLTVALVFLLGQQAQGKEILTLILSGIMVSSLFQAGTSFIKLVADPSDQLPEITYWLMGALSGAKSQDVLFAAIPITIGFLPLLLFRWRLNVLTLGDDEARTMGVNAARLRLVSIVSSTLLTAASVSVSGMIGWVGLVIPHFARTAVGNDYRYLMPASMLFGAAFLLIVDNLSRNLLATEIPIGILTAVIGVPFFLWLITRRKGEA